jgi:membrane-bound ClpP family serine protease
MAAQEWPGALLVVLVLVGSVILIAWLIFLFSYGYLYMKALAGGAYVPIIDLVGMKLRGVAPRVIVDSRIMALKAGIAVTTSQLETHCLAGGDVPNVVRTLIAARIQRMPVTFDEACAWDLAKRFPLLGPGSPLSGELAGAEGEALSPLGPPGIAMLKGKQYDVVTRGEMLEKGTRIKVIEVSGNRIVVKKV